MAFCAQCKRRIEAKRSSNQNRKYWDYLEQIADEVGENIDDLHEFFKAKLLPPRFITVRGQEVQLPGTTTELSTADFTHYMEKIAALTGIQHATPENFISNSQATVIDRRNQI